MIPLPVCKKTSVCGRGEKKPRAAAAAGVTVLPEKVGQAVLQSPPGAPSTERHPPLPEPPQPSAHSQPCTKGSRCGAGLASAPHPSVWAAL